MDAHVAHDVAALGPEEPPARAEPAVACPAVERRPTAEGVHHLRRRLVGTHRIVELRLTSRGGAVIFDHDPAAGSVVPALTR